MQPVHDDPNVIIKNIHTQVKQLRCIKSQYLLTHIDNARQGCVKIPGTLTSRLHDKVTTACDTKVATIFSLKEWRGQ